MIDFAPWERLLQTYVNTVGEVDYQRWQAEAAEALQDWLQALEKVELEALAEDERLALLLNLYNALVVQQILQLYPLDTIRPQILGVPNWVAFLYFFLKPVSRLGDRPISLNTLEHQLLRQQFQEPRMHFALVCAALGCPRLRNQAYWPDTMRSQLEADAQLFINNPAKVRYDSDRQILYCSKIFNGTRPIFAGSPVDRGLHSTLLAESAQTWS
ncbi:MAG: DUF547 domain-containing protein [Leptolyngbyaceae cyanobacterium RM2_2_21]|nr:DUF547 domain-containing protein [Leptolyngbyaceae cyanobacterium RM2_2_21]